jgi:hypothetical protein
MELSNVLSKVRGLVNRAEHPDTSPDEAAACRAKADEMMLKYAIKEAQLRESQPQADRQKPGKIMIELCDAGIPYEQFFTLLVSVICEHTRTIPLFMGAQMDRSALAAWRRYYGDLKVQAEVYGFESDLKYFEILYTTLLLHMSNGIDPKPDSSLTDDENVYNLHNSGFNWGEIAQMYFHRGRTPKTGGWDGVKVPAGEYYPGKYWKKCYERHLRHNKESNLVVLPAKFTEAARLNWRQNFAQSYVTTIRKRLWMARSGRQAGSEIILRSSMQAINDLLAAEHPNTNQMRSPKEVEYNEAAYRAGNDHAQSADLNGSTRVARHAAGELG